MFWPGFVVGMGFLLIATGLTIAAWKVLEDRIDYFIGISPVGGMLSAKITQTGIAIHKGTDKGAPFDGVTKIGDLVTIYEVKYVNDVQWAKIGDNQWICGGWRPRDPKKDLDPSTG